MCNIPLMLDLRGNLYLVHKLKETQVFLFKDQELFISKEPVEGDNKIISISDNKVLTKVHVGQEVLLNERSILAEVVETNEKGVVLQIKNEGVIMENTAVHFVNMATMESFSEKDENDLIEFGLKEGFDFVIVPKVHTKNSIEHVRDLLGPKGANIKILAKINEAEGIKNYEEILESADGIFIGRGDLAVEIGATKLMSAQKFLIERANLAGKPIITANQLIFSMISAPFPTRAEITDVCNAIYDGTDCLTLSAETSLGNFPIECVRTITEVID